MEDPSFRGAEGRGSEIHKENMRGREGGRRNADRRPPPPQQSDSAMIFEAAAKFDRF
jgi:hypothetical protein